MKEGVKVMARELMKGQSEIMEYILMIVFIVAAIIGMMLFLSWWNITQIQAQGFKEREDRVVTLAQNMMNDYMFVNGDSVFDDGKLTSVNAAGVGCDSLKEIYGEDWFVNITALDMPVEKKCDWSGYPDCNYWSFCVYQEHPESRAVYNFPVNVYRKATNRMAMGVMHVEVYT